MRFLIGIFLLIILQGSAQSLEGKWMIQIVDSKNYEWIKKDQDTAFQSIPDKVVLTNKGEYILRSGSYKKSGLAELSFGYWKLEGDKLSLNSKFGDVLMYEFKLLEYSKDKMKIELIYSFD